MNTLVMYNYLSQTARLVLQRPTLAATSDEESPTPLEEAAEAGDPEAMYHLGWAFEHGWGFPADPFKAASWYRRAADEGHDLAPARLQRVLAADGYRDAQYMAEDREAYDHDLSRLAAARLPPMIRVESTLDGGSAPIVFEVDPATLLEGVKARKPERIVQLANLYSDQVIKTRDHTIKARWLRRAAVRGQPPAMGAYALCHLVNMADTPPDLTEALRWIKKSASLGYVPAKYGLWKLHQLSPGMVPLDEAIAGLREAADIGLSLAQFDYGRLLKEGRHVPRDEELGRSYIKKAIKNGYSTRGRTPKYLYTSPETGTPETSSPETRSPETRSPKTGSPKTGSPKTGSARTAKGPKRKKRR